MELEQLEKSALRGESLPDKLKQPEQLLFLSLRCLYRDYRNKHISHEQAASEKRNIMSEYELAKYQYDCFWNSSARCNKIGTLMVDIEKNGCDLCRKIVRVFDGRESAK